jgi:hypothetical protein
MNCEELVDLLSSGAPLTLEAQEHIASCAGCSAMLQRLQEQPPAISPARVAAIEQRVLSMLAPVRPLPSNRRLAAVALGIAAVIAVVCAFPFGYFALKSLSAAQMAAYYSLIAGVGAFLAMAIAQDMIPGAKRTISRPLLVAGAFVLLAAAAIFLFPAFTAPHFVPRGIPCLRLGAISAAVAGIPIWLLLRRGFLTTPIETGCLAGTFAGLAGFAVLALHCPIQEAPHILTWHLGAMAIAGCTGALFGAAFERLAGIRRSAA